jgi:hypothetical protein
MLEWYEMMHWPAKMCGLCFHEKPDTRLEQRHRQVVWVFGHDSALLLNNQGNVNVMYSAGVHDVKYQDRRPLLPHDGRNPKPLSPKSVIRIVMLHSVK